MVAPATGRALWHATSVSLSLRESNGTEDGTCLIDGSTEEMFNSLRELFRVPRVTPASEYAERFRAARAEALRRAVGLVSRGNVQLTGGNYACYSTASKSNAAIGKSKEVL